MQIFQIADLAYLVISRYQNVPGYEQVGSASMGQHLIVFLPISQDEINNPEYLLECPDSSSVNCYAGG